MHPNDQLPEQLDKYIRNGIQKARRVKKHRKIRRGAGIACFLVLTLFLSLVRISPAFASYLSTIPGLEYVVDYQVYEFLSWEGRDSSNQELKRTKDGRGSSDNWSYVEYDYEYTFENPIQGPLRFEIIDYPNLIREDFEIQILPEQ